MSLAEKFEEYCEQQKKMFTDGDPIEPILKRIVQRAFYAGAQAALQNLPNDVPLGIVGQSRNMMAEILDQFRSHK